ncbi:Ribonuclease D (RNase D) [Durusdinium trenchii]|uniref:Ribonuclease D (RNase D) n=1 Tax=Durusdinium trenchii TaxID=1381693 RepID=A0ABP0RPP4_9DINO
MLRPWFRSAKRCFGTSYTVHLVSSQAQAERLSRELLLKLRKRSPNESSIAKIALDCEGVRLGRFGRLSLMQMQDEDGQVMLCDALRPGIVEAFRPLLESPSVVKVIHDCREDSSALYHQHGIGLRGIFDTQVAHASLERAAGREAYQASASELLQKYLNIDPDDSELKSLMLEDPQLWGRRPLSKALVSYAVRSVAYLLPLHELLMEKTNEIAEASALAADYRFLNREFPTAESMAKIGTRLWALMASRGRESSWLKLRWVMGRFSRHDSEGWWVPLGWLEEIWIAGDDVNMRFEEDVKLGDLVYCCVSGVSIDGRYLYLDRYDHDWDYFDHQLRPSSQPEVGAYGREHRFSSQAKGRDGREELC